MYIYIYINIYTYICHIPIGILNPFVVILRNEFRKLWQAGLDWDKPIPHDSTIYLHELFDQF